MNSQRRHLSFGARLVVAVALVFAVGGTFGYYWLLHDRLPEGSYPVALFAFPVS